MMRRTALSHITLPLLLLLLSLCSCTRNHGDIGPWFGTWHVESITAAGAPVNVEGDYFFQFQTRVFRVSMVGAHEHLLESFGIWQESGPNTMTVSFPDAAVYYIPMPGLEVHNDFTVTSTSSRDVTLTKADAAGTIYSYRLHRQP